MVKTLATKSSFPRIDLGGYSFSLTPTALTPPSWQGKDMAGRNWNVTMDKDAPHPDTLYDPGDEERIPLPDGGRLDMMSEGVYITDKQGVEVVSWVVDEWEDLDAVKATINAIAMGLKHGAGAVRQQIKKHNGAQHG